MTDGVILSVISSKINGWDHKNIEIVQLFLENLQFHYFREISCKKPLLP